MAAAAAADRLSSLPDQVLHRVLSYTSAKEAAASSVLSRRWHNLWLRAGTINLDTRHFGNIGESYDAFIRGAAAALAAFGAAGRPALRKATLSINRSCRPPRSYHSIGRNNNKHFNYLLGAVLGHPAMAALEELRVDFDDNRFHDETCTLQLTLLPCAATLRTLEITNCKVKAGTASGLSLPHLTSLHLRSCVLPEGYLQHVADAAPKLATLRLNNVRHKPSPQNVKPEKSYHYGVSRNYLLRFQLRCPAVTTFLLRTDCGERVRKDELALSNSGIELDMPSLQYFSYRGRPVRLTLTLPMPNLARVDIDDSGRGDYDNDRRRWSYGDDDGDDDRGSKKLVPLLSMIKSFCDTRALTLRVNCIEDIIDTGDEDGGHKDSSVLPVFPNLQLLDLEGHYNYNNKATDTSMACLLSSCPALSELRLKLTMMWNYRYAYRDPEENMRSGLDQFRFMASVDRFKSFKSALRVPFQGGIEGCCAISELPALSERTFSCLQASLRKVHLKFESREMNCFQVQLAKFLVENALPLEEIHINDGEKIFWDHLNHKVRKWRADAFWSKKLQNKGSFAVYHLADK